MFAEKSIILYAKMTLSQKSLFQKFHFKSLSFSYNNVTNTE